MMSGTDGHEDGGGGDRPSGLMRDLFGHLVRADYVMSMMEKMLTGLLDAIHYEQHVIGDLRERVEKEMQHEIGREPIATMKRAIRKKK
jgi:hypothetical protein